MRDDYGLTQKRQKVYVRDRSGPLWVIYVKKGKRVREVNTNQYEKKYGRAKLIDWGMGF